MYLCITITILPLRRNFHNYDHTHVHEKNTRKNQFIKRIHLYQCIPHSAATPLQFHSTFPTFCGITLWKLKIC